MEVAMAAGCTAAWKAAGGGARAVVAWQEVCSAMACRDKGDNWIRALSQTPRPSLSLFRRSQGRRVPAHPNQIQHLCPS